MLEGSVRDSYLRRMSPDDFSSKRYGRLCLQTGSKRILQKGFCYYCGKPIPDRKKRKYCSDLCRYQNNPSFYWDDLCRLVYERDNRNCIICAKLGNDFRKNKQSHGVLIIHHAIPLELGGTSRLDNLYAVCEYHHRKLHSACAQCRRNLFFWDSPDGINHCSWYIELALYHLEYPHLTKLEKIAAQCICLDKFVGGN
jgi:hypothetical protein